MTKQSRWVVTIAAAIAATALIAAEPTTAAREKKDDGLRPTAEKPLGCVQISRIRNTIVRDDSTIDFIMNNGDVYRNTLPNSCPSLGFEERFAYKTSISQLCSVDIITVLSTAGTGLMRGASCGLGKFQKMEKVAK